MDIGCRRSRGGSSVASASTSGNSITDSVFDCLYRNQPRPKTQLRRKTLNTSRDTFDSSCTPRAKGHESCDDPDEQDLSLNKSRAVSVSAEYTEDSEDVRRSIEWVNGQATLVQSFWRAERVRRVFRGKRASVVLIQSTWRDSWARLSAQRPAMDAGLKRIWRSYANRRKVETSVHGATIPFDCVCS